MTKNRMIGNCKGGIDITEQIKNHGNKRYNLALSKVRVKRIGKTLYLVTSNYSEDKNINELLKKVIEQEAEYKI